MNQLIESLSNIPEESYVVIDTHGTEQGLCLGELAEEIAVQQPYVNYVTAQNFTAFLNLPACTVINMGCMLGTEDYVNAFLKSGCTTYIGATDYPDGSSALVYVQILFYYMFNHKLSIVEAHERASKIDDETKYYALHYLNPDNM